MQEATSELRAFIDGWIRKFDMINTMPWSAIETHEVRPVS